MNRRAFLATTLAAAVAPADDDVIWMPDWRPPGMSDADILAAQSKWVEQIDAEIEYLRLRYLTKWRPTGKTPQQIMAEHCTGAVFEKSATGWAAYVPSLPGCVATGRTIAQTRERIQSAIISHTRS